MDQGVAGIVGAAVGGLIGVVGTMSSARWTGRDQRRNQHEHWLRQQRRDAYVKLIVKTSESLKLNQTAFDALVDERPDYPELISVVDETVNSLDIYVSTVQLEGPDEADLAALEMVGALRHWTILMALVVVHLQGDRDPIPTSLSYEEIAGAAECSYQALDNFTVLCRRLLND